MTKDCCFPLLPGQCAIRSVKFHRALWVEQVFKRKVQVQKSRGVQGQAGWGSEWPGLVGGIPAYAGGLEQGGL